ncbi:MAG: DUF5103 domain-containing protein [Bacteroidia bacterium]
MRLLTLLLIVVLSLPGLAQELRYENYVYQPDIRTVILARNTAIYDPQPIISLDGGDQLKLMFDQMLSQNEFYNYTIVHCDANWNPSDLQASEYIMGNPMGEISNFSFSTNTYQQYVHYNLTFPQENMKLTKSGNYLLKVFANFNEEDLVLTRRFMVLDSKTSIKATVNSATSAKFRNSHQEIDFEVDHKGYTIPNPFTDVKVTILQNNSWENAIYDLKPLFSNGQILNFNFEEGNLFQGGHEFRAFDIRSLRFFSNQVVKKYRDSVTNVVLRLDESRSHLTYTQWVDYNGKRVIENKDGVNIVEDGDYALVHFYLNTGDKSELGEIYIYGELSDWQLDNQFKMTYDPVNNWYYGSALLKQSYYNYQYVLKDKDGQLDYTFTEGSHYETENDYTILVYHRNVFYGYDELIGSIRKNSGANIRNNY